MSELVNVVTPVGELFYVRISGQGKENYNEDGYEYTAAVRLTGKKAEKLIAEIDDVGEQIPTGHSLKSTGYKELVKSKDGTLRSPSKAKPITKDEELSGIWEFSFKTNTTFADGKGKKIAVYNKDAKRVEMGERMIGNGSLGSISGKMKGASYKKEFSVSLYLNAIQLTQFEEYVGDAGFEAQDEGDFDGPVDGDSGFTGQAEDDAEEEAEEPKTKVKPKL